MDNIYMWTWRNPKVLEWSEPGTTNALLPSTRLASEHEVWLIECKLLITKYIKYRYYNINDQYLVDITVIMTVAGHKA